MEPFATLGRELSARWARVDGDEQQFPALAAAALERARVHEHFAQRDLLRWLAETPLLPQQNALGFGQPPITLYRDDRLYIEALFWLDATTTIHQHAFSGAFCVLEGGSVHASYAFRETRRVNDQLLLGELTLTGIEVLAPGQVRPIAAGRAFIHALFHLDHPTLSVVVRTHHAAAHPIQYEYQPPGLALDPFWQSAGWTRRLDVLDTLLACAHPELRAFAEASVDAADAIALTKIVQRLNVHEQGFALVAPLLERARTRHGGLVDALSEVLTRERARTMLTQRRKTINEPGPRFLLALLLNVSGRKRILSLVRERHPERDPVQTVMQWLRAMHDTRTEHGNALGVELNAHSDWVLERLLEGKSESEIAAEAAREARDVSPMQIAQSCFMLPFNSVLGPLLAAG